MPTLRFTLAPFTLIDDYDALMSTPPTMRKLGVRLEEVSPGRYGHVPTGEVIEVSARGEYIKHARNGELLPADQATATYCGVAFSPKPTTKKAEAAVKES